MLIQNIILQNFRSHKSTTIDFKPGISVIIGENGAGKSSIMEGISFALFKQFRSNKIDKLITDKTHNMAVELVFNVNGKNYRVKRERRRNGRSDATLESLSDNVFLSRGDQDVNEEVQKILDMDKDLFLNAIYVRQGEIDTLIEKSPAEKKRMLSKLLGIDNLNKAWKNMLTPIKNFEDKENILKGKLMRLPTLKERYEECETKEKEVDTYIGEQEKREKTIEGELSNLKGEKKDLDAKESKLGNLTFQLENYEKTLEGEEEAKRVLKERLRTIELNEKRKSEIEPKLPLLEILNQLKLDLTDLNELEKYIGDIDKTISKIDGHNEIIRSNKESYDNFSKIDGLITDLEKLREPLEGSNALLQSKNLEKKKIIKKISNYEKEIKDGINSSNKILRMDITSLEELNTFLTKTIPELKDKKKKCQSKIDTFDNQISEIKGINHALDKQKEDLCNAGDTCPICQSDITENRRNSLFEDYSSNIKNNNGEIEKIELLKSESEEYKISINDRIGEIEKINIEMLLNHEKYLKQDEEELEKIDKELLNIENDSKAFNEINDEIKTKRNELSTLEDSYKKYNESVIALKSLDDYDTLVDEKKELQEEYEKLEKNVQKQVMELEIDIDGLDNKISELSDLKDEFKELSGKISQKNELLGDLKSSEDKINELNSNIDNLRVDIKEIDYSEDIHNKINKDYSFKERELSDLGNEIIVKKAELKGIQRNIGETKNEIDELETEQNELEKLKKYIKFLNELRELYGKDGIQKELRNYSRPIIEKNTAEFFERFNFEYSDIKLDENYDITVYSSAGEKSLDMVSGGEKVAIALALRLGITETLSKGNLELIMLDEPTIHLDEYRRQELIELIKRLYMIPQMIIVTHENDLEEAADNIIKIKKENGESLVYN